NSIRFASLCQTDLIRLFSMQIYADWEVKSAMDESWSFVAQGGHGIEAAGAEGWNVASGAGNEGESGGGEAQRQWIMGSEAEELTLDDTSQGESGGDACHNADGYEKKDFAHDQPDDVAAGSAEGDANADFSGALGDSVGHDAVETDDSEQSGEEAEDCGK